MDNKQATVEKNETSITNKIFYYVKNFILSSLGDLAIMSKVFFLIFIAALFFNTTADHGTISFSRWQDFYFAQQINAFLMTYGITILLAPAFIVFLSLIFPKYQLLRIVSIFFGAGV